MTADERRTLDELIDREIERLRGKLGNAPTIGSIASAEWHLHVELPLRNLLSIREQLQRQDFDTRKGT